MTDRYSFVFSSFFCAHNVTNDPILFSFFFHKLHGVWSERTQRKLNRIKKNHATTAVNNETMARQETKRNRKKLCVQFQNHNFLLLLLLQMCLNDFNALQ